MDDKTIIDEAKEIIDAALGRAKHPEFPGEIEKTLEAPVPNAPAAEVPEDLVEAEAKLREAFKGQLIRRLYDLSRPTLHQRSCYLTRRKYDEAMGVVLRVRTLGDLIAVVDRAGIRADEVRDRGNSLMIRIGPVRHWLNTQSLHNMHSSAESLSRAGVCRHSMRDSHREVAA